MTPQALTLQIYRSWDAALWQTSAEQPLGAVAALLAWTAEPGLIDGGPPAGIERLVSACCAELGPVAFRLFFDSELSSSAVIRRAPRRFLPIRIWERLTRRWAADIAIVTTAPDVAQMFEQHWSLQQQAALVLENNADTEAAIDMLRRSRDWRKHALPHGVLLLVAPAVDGDGILFAARSATQLDAVLARLEAHCRQAGLPFEHAP